MWNDDDRKWLFEQMKKAGVDTGTYEDFTNSLKNQADRDWYYQKSLNLGLEVGSADDFAGMMVEPVTQPQQTAHAGDAAGTAAQPIQTNVAQPVVQTPTTQTQQEQPQRTLQSFSHKIPVPVPKELEYTRMGDQNTFVPVRDYDQYEQAMQLTPQARRVIYGEQKAQQMERYSKQEEIDAMRKEAQDRLNAFYQRNGITDPDRGFAIPKNEHEEYQAILDRMSEASALQRALDESTPKTVAQQLDEARKELARLKRGLKSKRARNAENDALYGNLNSEPSLIGMMAQNSRYDTELAAIRTVEDRIRTLEAEQDDEGQSMFWRGFWDAMRDPSVWSLGVSDLDTSVELVRIKEKMEAGEELTATEQTLLNTTVENQEAEQQYGSNRGFMYRAGNITMNALPFVGEFLLSGGGMDFINAAGKATAKASAKMAAKSAAEGAGKSAINNAVTRWIVRNTGVLADDVTRGFLMANTTGAARTTSDILNRHMGQVIETDDGYQFVGGEDWGDAIYHGEVANTLEYYTEMLGAHFGGAGAALDKGLNKIGLSKLSGALNRIKGSQFYQAGDNLLAKGGIHDLIGEGMEEEANLVLNSLLVGDNQLSDLFDGRTQADIWGGMALSLGFMRAPQYAGTGYQTAQYYRYKQKTHNADVVAGYRLTPEKWEPIRERIDNATNEEMADVITDVIGSDQLQQQEKEAVMGYVNNLLQMRGYNMGTMANAKDAVDDEDTESQQSEQAVEQSYSNGYNATDEQQMNDAKNMLDYQRQRIGEFATDDMLAQLDADPVGALNAIRGSDAWTDEEKHTATDYVNAKATYDGMIQHVRDDIDSQLMASDAAIDSHVHNADGMIHPATMKVDDRRVYVIGGNVVMNEDGTMVDHENSDESIIIRDAETGNIEFADPRDVLSVDEALDAAQEKQAAQDAIRQEYAQQAADKIDGVLQFNDGDTYTATDEQGQQHTVVVVPNGTANSQGQILQAGEGEALVSVDGAEPAPMSREDIQGMVDATNLARLQQFEQEKAQRRAALAEAQREASRPVYSINDEVTLQTDEGQVRGSITAEANEDGLIEVYTERPIGGKKINLYNRDELDAMLIEHNGAQQQVETPAGEITGTAAQQADGETQLPPLTNEGIDAMLGAAPAADAAGTAAGLGENAQEVHGDESGQQPAGETAGAAAQPMPMIGEGEDAEPDFSKVEPARAHTFIYNEAGLSRDEANQFVEANKKAADKALTTIQGKKPKMGTSLAKYRKDTAEWEQKVAQAQQQADYWKQVKDEQGRIVAAERAAQAERDAQLHEQAVADEQERQAAVIQQREEQAALGTHNVAPAIREKWEAAPKVEGARNELVLANGEKVPGRYVLVESGAATPSHNPAAGFTKNEGFPMDENEQSVNDRDYERDQDAQTITRQIADQYDSRAMQTPVVVSSEGVVLSGNGRTMAGELAAQNGTDGAYIEHLKKYGQQYGFTPEQVEGMQHPRVLFIPDEAMPYTADTFAKFNQQEMKGQSKTEQAVKLGKIVDDDTFGRVIKSINAFDTLGDFYADPTAATEAINELRNAGAISQAQYAEMFDGDTISAQGREILENMLIGKAFESNPDAVRQITAFKGVRQSIICALAEISNNLMLGKDFSLESELAQAISLVYQARNGGYKAGDKVSGYARQLNLFPFDEGESVADYTNATVLMLADVMNDNRVTRLKKWMSVYNNAAQDSANGQMDLFSGGVKSKDDIINEVKQLFNNGTEEEQQAAVAAAVEQRTAAAAAAAAEQQERAGEGAEQNGTGLDGDEGHDVAPETPAAEPQDTVDAAVASAEAETNTSPTDGQKEAGNYKKGHVKIDGFDISIENPKGSTRSGMDDSGKEWSVTMRNTYGYMRGTEGVDGDHIDVFLSDHLDDWNGMVYVVDQVNADGSFDEHKVMYGFNSADEARAAYLSNYEEGWQGLGVITEVSKDEFKKWVNSSHRKTKPFADYKSVKPLGGQHEGVAMPSQQTEEANTVGAEVAAEWLLSSGQNAINSTDYLLKALSGVFSKATQAIEAIRQKYAPQFAASEYSEIKNFVGSDLYQQVVGEIKNVLDGTYNNAEASNILDTIMQSPMGLPMRTGQEVSRRLEALEQVGNTQLGESAAVVQQPTEQQPQVSLTEGEAETIIGAMKDRASFAPFVEITDENWRDSVTTPIGEVRMGANQKEKLFAKGREQQYGMVLETLEHPDLVLEETDKEENMFHERPSSYLFVKTFQKPDGSKYVHFESVTVQQDGMEVSVSSHIIRENQLRNKVKSDRLLYKATALDEPAHSSAEQPTNEGSSLSSEGKGTNNSSSEQGKEEKTASRTTRQTVFHGSRADFERFDHTHMGEGEGSQVFGWGTYVSGSDKVAQGYVGDVEGGRNLYTVSIPEDTGDNYLIWQDVVNDGLLGKVTDELSTIDSDDVNTDYFLDKLDDFLGFNNLLGSDLYKMLEKYAFDGNAERASRFLSSIGLVGIKYPAGTIKGNGYGATNYVIFNESDLSITDHLRYREGETQNGTETKQDEPKRKRSKKEQRQAEAYAARQWRRAHEWAKEWIEKLKIGDVCQVYDSIDDVPGAKRFSKRKRSAKGWYDTKTGKIVIVLGNHRSPQDVVQTILHEAVGHYGLRQLFGQHFDTFLDNVLENANLGIKERIAAMAADLMAKERSAKKSSEEYMRVATEEYLAHLAEDTDFERATQSGWWQTIKECFLKMLHSLGLPGFTMKEEASPYGVLPGMKQTAASATISDNELRYILWRSYENLAEPGRYRNPFREAEDVSKQTELGVGNQARIVRMGHIEDEIPLDRIAELEEAGEEAVAREDVSDESLGNVEAVNGRFNEQLSGLTEENADKIQLSLGSPSAVLLAAGVEDKPMKLYGNKVIKKLKKHGFSLDELRGLPRAVAEPIAVFDNYQQDGNRTILTELRSQGKNIMVAITLGKNGVDVDFNIVSSVFGKGYSNIVDWIKKGYLRYVDKEKALDYLHFSERSISEASNDQELNSAAKVIENFENPSIEDRKNADEGEKSSEEGGELFREGDSDGTREAYNQAVNTGRKKTARMTSFNFREAFQDALLSVKKLQEVIEQKYGMKLASYEDAWKYENALSSINMQQRKRFIDTLYEPMMKVADKLLKAGASVEELNEYLICKHGLERNRVFAERDAQKEYDALVAGGKPADLNALIAEKRERDYSGLTEITGKDDIVEIEAEAQRRVQAFEQKYGSTCDDLWDAINKTTKWTLEKSYRSGMMSKQTYEKVRDMFEWYVPLRGWDAETAEDAYDYMMGDRGAFNGTLKTAEGRTSTADDPLATIGNMGESAILQGNRNILKRRLLNMAMNYPTDVCTVRDMWVVENAQGEWEANFPQIPEDATADEVAQILEQHEADMEALAQQGKAHRQRNSLDIDFHINQRDVPEHAVVAYLNGQQHVVYINGNPRAAQAINGRTGEDNSSKNPIRRLVDFLFKDIKRFYSSAITGYSPNFAVANIVRDLGHCIAMTYVNKGALDMARYVAHLPQSIAYVIKNQVGRGGNAKADRYFREFVENGGITGYAHLNDVDHWKADNAKRWSRLSALKKGRVAPVRGAKAFISALGWFSETLELIPRFNTYWSEREDGKDVATAIKAAKDITVNFNKKGSELTPGVWGAVANTLRYEKMFFNPIVQGLNQFYEAGKAHPVRFAVATLHLPVLGAIAPYVNMLLVEAFGGGDGDDDKDKYDYWLQNEYTRRNNVLLFTGKGYVKIPIAPGFRELYGMGEALATRMFGKADNMETARALADQLRTVFSVEGQSSYKEWSMSRFILPEHLAPLVDIMNNENFTGGTLYYENQYREHEPEYQKAKQSTWSPLVSASKQLNEWLGGDEDIAAPLSGKWMNPAVWQHLISNYGGGFSQLVGDVTSTASNFIEGKEQDASQWPMLKRFYMKPTVERAQWARYGQYKKFKEDYDLAKEKYSAIRKKDLGPMEEAEAVDAFARRFPRAAAIYSAWEGGVRGADYVNRLQRLKKAGEEDEYWQLIKEAVEAAERATKNGTEESEEENDERP